MTDVQRPAAGFFYSEPLRAAAGLLAWPATSQLWRVAPRGSGAPVLVLPGLLASDASTRPLRTLLRRLDHYVRGWRLGQNLGPTPEIEQGLGALVERLAGTHDQRLAIVGWSLGGIYARAIAAARPDLVRLVVTLGSPFAMSDARQSRAQRAYRRQSHLHTSGRGDGIPAAIRGPLPVPSTSIWSKQDGIVSWTASLESPSPSAENIEVFGSHLGLGHNAAVLYAVADRLALPDRDWRPFRPPSWLRGAYPGLAS